MKPRVKPILPRAVVLAAALLTAPGFAQSEDPESGEPARPTQAQANEHLLLSAEAGDVAGVRLALDAGADPMVRDDLDMTALHYAGVGGSAEVAAMMLEAGVPVDTLGFHSPNDGQVDATPLQIAAEVGSLDVIKILVAAGANVNSVTRFDRTPLFMARKYGQDAVADYLEGLGASADPDEARANPLPGGRAPAAADGADEDADAADPDGRQPAAPDASGAAGGDPDAEPDATAMPPSDGGNLFGATPPPPPEPEPPPPLPPEPVPVRPILVISADTVLEGGPLSALWRRFQAAHPDWQLDDSGHRHNVGAGVQMKVHGRVDALPSAWISELMTLAVEEGMTPENPDAEVLAASPEALQGVQAAETERFETERAAYEDARRARIAAGADVPDRGDPGATAAGRPD